MTQQFSNDQLRWLSCISDLKIDRSRGPAPHKPILLLVLCDLIEEGLICDGLIKKDGALAFRFTGYWAIVANRRKSRPEVMLPFFHLHSDGIFTPLDENGIETDNRLNASLAQISPSLLLNLQLPEFRYEFRQTLITRYFEFGEQIQLFELCEMDVPPRKIAESDSTKYLVAEDSERKRDGKFSVRVLPAYDFTCALTNYRMISSTGSCPLDAAHIRQFKSGGACHPTNGIALSKNSHWLFDRGFWSLDDNYRVLVNTDRFDEDGDEALLLKPRSGKRISLPKNEHFWPDKENLNWHRSNHKFQ